MKIKMSRHPGTSFSRATLSSGPSLMVRGQSINSISRDAYAMQVKKETCAKPIHGSIRPLRDFIGQQTRDMVCHEVAGLAID
jgi:hypothetical protein